jgi:hypothetical protein
MFRWLSFGIGCGLHRQNSLLNVGENEALRSKSGRFLFRGQGFGYIRAVCSLFEGIWERGVFLPLRFGNFFRKGQILIHKALKRGEVPVYYVGDTVCARRAQL